MEMCYSGALAMPKNYAVVSEDEMTYLEGGASYYNTAGTLANTCQVNADLLNAESILLGLAGSIPGALSAAICTHNANMYIEAKGKCSNYAADTYITLTINYSGPLWISSTSVKVG